jgi:hypothetical protein
MHEFAFTITYDDDVDEYAQAFIENESLQSEAVYACLDPSQLWVLETVTGDAQEVSTVSDLVLDESLDRESVSGRPCEATRRTSRLASDPRRLVTYTYVTDVTYCDAVPFIAAKYVTDGVFFRQTRTGATAHWEVFVQNDDKIGLLYDTLSARLGDGLHFSFDHVTEVAEWDSQLLSPDGVRAEQRDVLVVAVERGYFETPREVTLDELAAELDLPRSTVSYRLRRATAELAKAFVEHQP